MAICHILSWVSREQAQLVWRRAAHLHAAAQWNIFSIVGLQCTPCRSKQISLSALSYFHAAFVGWIFQQTITLQIQGNTPRTNTHSMKQADITHHYNGGFSTHAIFRWQCVQGSDSFLSFTKWRCNRISLWQNGQNV